MLKDSDGRRRTPEFRVVTRDGEVRGPDLPPGDWPEQTVLIYEALRRDAIATNLTPTDWQHVIDTMNLHRILWSDEPSNALKVAAEVRLRLQSLGVTPEARMRMRLMVEDETKPVSRLDDLRNRSAARRASQTKKASNT